jgi:hypothetical protein
MAGWRWPPAAAPSRHTPHSGDPLPAWSHRGLFGAMSMNTRASRTTSRRSGRAGADRRLLDQIVYQPGIERQWETSARRLLDAHGWRETHASAACRRRCSPPRRPWTGRVLSRVARPAGHLDCRRPTFASPVEPRLTAAPDDSVRGGAAVSRMTPALARPPMGGHRQTVSRQPGSTWNGRIAARPLPRSTPEQSSATPRRVSRVMIPMTSLREARSHWTRESPQSPQ